MDDETISVEQVAKDLKLSKATVWLWCKKGTLRGAYKMPGSRKWLISKKEFEKQKKELMKINYENK